jgi:hypothetical protein
MLELFICFVNYEWLLSVHRLSVPEDKPSMLETRSN